MSGERLDSPLWYRVAGLRPALAAHAEVQRQVHGGEVWYVLHNRASGRFFRFSPAAYHLIGQMDGSRTMEAIWEAAGERLRDDAPSQEEALDLLVRLSSAGALQTDIEPDVEALLEADARQQRARRGARWKNPLAVRIPLLDPDRWLARLSARLGPLLGWRAALVWGLVVAAGVLGAVIHWDEIASEVRGRLLAQDNLFFLALAYPLVKALHELGHGLVTRARGGEVHEMGVMLLALIPVPYVDATSATGIVDRRGRMLVGAAGILVELFLAALALFVWRASEPGLAHAFAYNVMVIGGLSTLLVNGNPLLRYDGYYVLADAIGVPNLATRANRYLAYLAQRYLFGVAEAQSPAGNAYERRWLAAYGLAASLYRVFIIVVIILFVAQRYPYVGVVLALWAVATQLALPLYRATAFLLTDPHLSRRRPRALAVSLGLLAGGAGLLGGLPLPLTTLAQGVVRPPDASEVRAGGDGQVLRLLARPGARVALDTPLVETDDPLLAGRIRVLEARRRELVAERDAHLFRHEQVRAELLGEKIRVAESELALARERHAALTLRSPTDGVFLVAQPEDLPGRFVHQGDLIGYVADTGRSTLRVVVPQADIGMVKTGVRAVEVRLAERLDRPLPADVVRVVPAAISELPSAALGSRGGGPIAVIPDDPDGRRAAEPVFELELRIAIPVGRIGGRAYVRFDHGGEPLAWQWYRRIRQLFLGRFGV